MTQILRVKLYQPAAHFRVPFSYQRRFTYPLPPLATVKGLLCNLLGIKSDESPEYKALFSLLSLAVYGKFTSIVKEYTWFRNLSIESHKKKFHTPQNRIHDFAPQHPGGQMPVSVDVLNDNHILLYISVAENIDMRQAFLNPENRNDVISLGRAEDMLVIENVKLIEPTKKEVQKIGLFTWIPDIETVDKSLLPNDSNYKKFYDSAPGNIIKLPLFYRITENNERVFDTYATVKLYEGGIWGAKVGLLYDMEYEIPLIFSKVRNQ